MRASVNGAATVSIYFPSLMSNWCLFQMAKSELMNVTFFQPDMFHNMQETIKWIQNFLSYVLMKQYGVFLSHRYTDSEKYYTK